MASTTFLSTIDHHDTSIISTLHHDIIEDHILSRLDGSSLATLSCTCSYFQRLSSHETLWREICASTWPSLAHAGVIQLISNDHRSFFSNSFPLLTPYDHPRNSNRLCSSLPSELISAVDIRYYNKPILSRVVETETESEWFLDSPFRVDLLDAKEVQPTRMKVTQGGDDSWKKDLEENLTLSWIILDPTTKKSANFSSIRPVSVEKHWLTGEFRVAYATVLRCDRVGFVRCKVVVTCRGLERGELHVREACMKLKDLDGKRVSGKDSLVCLVNAIEHGKRKRADNAEGKKLHEEYLREKRLRREKKILKERVLEMACGVGVIIYVAFCTRYLIDR